MKKFFAFLLLLLVLSCLLFFVFNTQKNSKEIKISDIKISITSDFNPPFISNEDLKELLLKYEPKIIGKEINSLNIQRLENLLKTQTLLKKVNISHTTKGILKVNIETYSPLFSVLSQHKNFYVTKNRDTLTFTSPQKNSPFIPIVHGDVSVLQASTSIYDLLLFLSKNSKWKDFFCSFYFDKNRNELIGQTKYKNLEINLGSLGRWEEKFSSLNTFKREVIDEIGWHSFSNIYLEYPNKIIATPQKELLKKFQKTLLDLEKRNNEK